MLAYDFDRDAPAITATSAEFPESAMGFMVPPGLNGDGFEAFRQAGGKMLIYHGLSDPVFSATDTVNWYQNLPNAQKFSRLYLIPGMPHGHAPAAPDDLD